MPMRRTYIDITLVASEPLGRFEVYRTKDVHGVEGQFTLLGSDDVRHEVLVVEQSSSRLFATASVEEWAEGQYEIEGLVQDVAGNRLILTRCDEGALADGVVLLTFNLIASVIPGQWEIFKDGTCVGHISVLIELRTLGSEVEERTAVCQAVIQ
jgi:hypothetical protein